MSAAHDEAVELLCDLVPIDSVTPWLVPGGAGEKAIVARMAEYFEQLGVEIEIDEIEAGRLNLLATVRGSGAGPTLCLNAHADTVGYDNWRAEALQPRLAGDRLYGLGAADDKAGCVAILLTLKALASDPPASGTLLAAFVADEEALSIGTEKLVQRGGIDAAIVIEPHGLDEVVVAHQGFGWIDIVTRGVAAHGSAPEQGVDSIAHMAQVITALRALDRDAGSVDADGRLHGRAARREMHLQNRRRGLAGLAGVRHADGSRHSPPDPGQKCVCRRSPAHLRATRSRRTRTGQRCKVVTYRPGQAPRAWSPPDKAILNDRPARRNRQNRNRAWRERGGRPLA